MAEPQACCIVRPAPNQNKYYCEDLEPCDCINGSLNPFRQVGVAKGIGTKCSDFCDETETGQIDPGDCLYCKNFWGSCCTYNNFTHLSDGCFNTNLPQNCRSLGGLFYYQTPCAASQCGPYYNANDMQDRNNNYWVGCCYTLYDEVTGEVTGVACEDMTKQQCSELLGIQSNICTLGVQCSSHNLTQPIKLCAHRLNSPDSTLRLCAVDVACCLPGGQGCQTTPLSTCCALGGVALELGTKCETEPDDICEQHEPPQNCFEAREDTYPPGKLGWSTNWCENTFYTAYRRPPEEYPTNDPDFQPGFIEFISVTPIRAMDTGPLQRASDEEPCAYHTATPTLIDGFLSLAYCGQYEFSDSTTKYDYLAQNVFIQRDPDINEVVPQGDTVFVGMYSPPKYTEVQYHGQHYTCGFIPV